MKVGDKVEWESQSLGNWTRKVGVIVAVVPAGRDPKWLAPSGTVIHSLHAYSRNEESYLVQVGKRRLLYWPRVSWLSMAQE